MRKKTTSKAYLQPNQTPDMELFKKIANDLKHFLYSLKSPQREKCPNT